MAAEHWPMRNPCTARWSICESIDPADYPFPAIWDNVRAELQRHSHAVLPKGIGRRLMGLDCQDDDPAESRRAASN
jgi:hypothetical protein